MNVYGKTSEEIRPNPLNKQVIGHLLPSALAYIIDFMFLNVFSGKFSS